MKSLLALCALILAVGVAVAEEPDGLKLPPGFHATVVAEGLGPIRHLTVRANGDLYISTPVNKQNSGNGIIALHLDANHRADQIVNFSDVDGGTGIVFNNDELYASTASAVYRFKFSGDGLLPEKDPDIIVDGIPVPQTSVNSANVPLALDGKGNLYLALQGIANRCSVPNPPSAAPPVGLNPCPDLKDHAGIWRFNADKANQKFASDGEQLATGIRNTTALAWSPDDAHLYVITQGVDNTHKSWPQIVSEQADDQIADEMHRVTKGADLGWPYTYYDGVRKLRLMSPEYGGDGNKTAPDGKYATPVLTFQSRRASEVDLVFYSGKQFPASYAGGAFIVQHGTRNRNGYDVVFVPFNRKGVAGAPTVFADGFAAFDAGGSTADRARYRPIGAAVGPDGSLYVADSEKGRIWRIAYEKN